jgi:hypothetical protein
MSAIHQILPSSPVLAAPRLRLQLPTLRRRPARPGRSLAELLAPVLILVLLLVAGLIWLAVGGAVMRGTR